MKILIILLLTLISFEWYTIKHERQLLQDYKGCLKEIKKISGCTNWIYDEELK